jgi:Trypsin-like peptidase domain
MAEREPSLFGTSPLGGESAADRFGFKSDDGKVLEGSPAVFPIIRYHPDGKIGLLGTGFFISTVGLFATARHVLEAAFDRRTGKEIFPCGLVHFHEEGGYLIRPILRFAPHPIADLTVGVAAPMRRNSDGAPLQNKILTLSTNSIEIGSHVTTYAYPRYESVMVANGQIFNVMPCFYDGKIIEHLPDGRDRVLLPGPCYRTNIKIHHGASGGPVFSKDGKVFALNSTGFDGTEDSYVSSIGGVLDLTIDDVEIGGEASRSVSIREIVSAGHIILNGPVA